MKPKKSKRTIKDILKEALRLFSLPLVYMCVAYMGLFVAFMMVVTDRGCHAPSDWILENFCPEAKINASLNHFYAKLWDDQEQLEADFQKVIDQNLWNLYES